ncbi:Polysaccharide biosynthesis protein [Buttiauxella agrestis]|uniref:Polysaccharide biosynthesis protein n=1 Tax=Buttiauxella agrestis TaxID=82977 RepID=A0A381C6X6_9ENTR|nr:polysaccharide biosynthesis C-terminal domain-containing protein [Buttiauxella agrestis]SUW63089.1 Polysaccharide biosynthesis protein [Buttiauxella agrestis]
MSGFNRLIKNSVANIINGFSNVIMGIVISPLLLHKLTTTEFSVWSLALQAGALIGIIGFGLQITVGRFVSLHRSDQFQLRSVLYNSKLVSYILASMMLILVLVINHYYSSFFTAIPVEYQKQAKTTFLLICISFIINNISSIYLGYFTGIERNDITASVNLVFKTILGVFIVFIAKYGIFAMCIVYFSINLINQIFFFYIFNRNLGKDATKKTMNAVVIKKIAIFYIGLLIWNIAQFLITGIGTFTVGKFAFNELAGYVLAMTLINAVVGIIGAITSPIIQPMLRLYNAGKVQNLEKLVVLLSLLYAFIVYIAYFVSSNISGWILNLWLGHDLSVHIESSFTLLLTAFLIRMIAAPYGMMLVAFGKQLSVAYLPLLEGVINFTLSIFFVKEYGAVGIAYATAISGMSIMVFYAFKFYRESEIRDGLIFTSFLIIPATISVLMLVNYYFAHSLYGKYIHISQLALSLISLILVAILIRKIKSIVD